MFLLCDQAAIVLLLPAEKIMKHVNKVLNSKLQKPPRNRQRNPGKNKPPKKRPKPPPNEKAGDLEDDIRQINQEFAGGGGIAYGLCCS